MPVIKFIPSGKTADVPDGTELVDAAAQAGVDLSLECGGKGTCGKCLVQITSGAVKSRPGRTNIDADHPTRTIACLSVIDGPAEITVFTEKNDHLERSGEDSIDSSVFSHPALKELSPMCRSVLLNISPPQKEDGLSDLDRFTAALRTAVQTENIDIPLSVIRGLPSALRADNGRVNAVISGDSGPIRVVSLAVSHPSEKIFGAAVDLGTTTVSVQLIDLASGETVCTKNGYNTQINCGLDVISRINFASNSARLNIIKNKAVESINRLIEHAAHESGINIDKIMCGVISGNTVMMHLLLGIDPEYIRLEPYTPALLGIPRIKASDAGIAVNPEAEILFSPCAGSYVGGDITAGILCTAFAGDDEEMSLFIDIGTNGEIVLGNKDFLMTCACSAGPAFEGGGIESGMRATNGAIDKVILDKETGVCTPSVIGGGLPAGICGSGLIDLIAQLFLSGWIDSSGKLNREKQCPSIHIDGRRAYYTVSSSENSAEGRAVVLSENDILNFMRAKAAVYSAASLLLEQAGISFSDLSAFYIAGGFGRFLNIESAVAVGLLPDIPVEKFIYCGNTSLAGSRLLLLSNEFREKQQILARRMTYIDLSGYPGYMDHYTAALFFPHTDFRLFPSVKPEAGKQ